MHLPLSNLLPLLPLAHPSPSHPNSLTARQLTCATTPSPHLQHADCLRALTSILDPQPHINHDPTDLSVLSVLTPTGAMGSPNRLPRSFSAGTCRVNVQFANDARAVRILWAEVMARALNVVDLCVDADVPKGGTSSFGPLKVVVEEMVPRVGVGLGAL